MTKRLFVGNLPYQVTNEELTELFSKAGKVVSANVIIDRMTGTGKGFAFVEMETEAEAEEAMKTLNGAQLGDRNIRIDEAKPQEQRSNDFSARGGRDGGRRDFDRGGSRNSGRTSRGKRW